MGSFEVKILLEPTTRVEMLGGVQYRVYEGKTDTGIVLEMLGLFRIADVADRHKFTADVCASKPGDPAPVRLLSSDQLVKP